MTEISDNLMRKLRALAEQAERGGTENEREMAAQRMAEIMAKHQIESFDLSVATPEADEGRLDADDGAPPSRVEHWEKVLLSTLADVFGGRAWTRGKGRLQEMRMVGPAGSIAAARYMYLWLRQQVNHLARAAGRACGEDSNAWRRAYATGMVSKIYKRMTDARRVVATSSETALVVVDRQKVAVERRFAQLGDLRRGKGGRLQRGDAKSEGWRDGDHVDLGNAGSARLGAGQRRLGS